MKICPLSVSLSEVFTCRRILYVTIVSSFIVNSILNNIFNIAVVSLSENFTDSQKQEAMGVLFLGSASAKLLGGRLSEIFGPKRVIGCCLFFGAVVTVLTPFIVTLNYYVFLASRVVFGFLLGMHFTAVFPLFTHWFPPTTQSFLMSSIDANFIGFSICYACGGFLIAAYGWSSIFYAMGVLSMCWCLVWFYLIYDNPNLHPRIPADEKMTILSEVGDDIRRRRTRVPWTQIIKSVPVWAIIFGQVASFVDVAIINSELPLYLNQALGFDINDVGKYSGLALIGKFFASMIFGYTSDRLLESHKLSAKSSRRLFETIGLLLPGVLMLVQFFFGENVTVSMTCIILEITLNAACVSGHYVNLLDISPNFCGTLAGIAFTMSSIFSYLSTKITAVLLENGHNLNEWRFVFLLLSLISVVGGVVYVWGCSTEVQSWNSEVEETTEREVCNSA